MDTVQIYASFLGGLAMIAFIHRTFRRLHLYSILYRAIQKVSASLRHCGHSLRFLFLKNIVYLFIYRRSRIMGPMTLLEAILHIAHLALTAVYNLYNTSSMAEVAERSGNLSVINLVPLLLAGRPSLIANLLGLSLRSYVRVHGTMGAMACIQALIHIVISIRLREFSVSNSLHLTGILVRFIHFNFQFSFLLTWFRVLRPWE